MSKVIEAGAQGTFSGEGYWTRSARRSMARWAKRPTKERIARLEAEVLRFAKSSDIGTDERERLHEQVRKTSSRLAGANIERDTIERVLTALLVRKATREPRA